MKKEENESKRDKKGSKGSFLLFLEPKYDFISQYESVLGSVIEIRRKKKRELNKYHRSGMGNCFCEQKVVFSTVVHRVNKYESN